MSLKIAAILALFLGVGSPTLRMKNIATFNNGFSKHKSQQPQALTNVTWQLTELYGMKVTDTSLTRSGYLVFTSDGKVSGSAGCNKLVGGFSANSNMEIKFGTSMASTLMACPDTTKEMQFKKMLVDANTFSIKDGKLKLSKNSTTLAVFQARELNK